MPVRQDQGVPLLQEMSDLGNPLAELPYPNTLRFHVLHKVYTIIFRPVKPSFTSGGGVSIRRNNMMYKVMYNKAMERKRKIRKQIYLDPEQDAHLKRQAAAFRVSEAEVIRWSLSKIPMEDKPLHRPELWEQEKEYIRKRMADLTASEPPTPRTWERKDLYDRPRWPRS